MGIRLLDCTLRDGAYVVEAKFGAPTIKGIIKRLQDAGVDIIECGWLKDKAHEEGTSYYHVPEDLCQYLPHKNKDTVYAAMIDWDRYDLAQLPENDGKAIDAIRVVFPHGHFKEGAALAGTIKEKGYKAYLQAANTLAYSDKELTELADLANEAGVEALSIVDTFGAMYGEDLERIAGILDGRLKKGISLGFHSHNNQQLSFALCMEFAKCLEGSGREAVIDASLCGMGRGAGNATTELVANFLNRRYHGDYDMDLIMDTIDIYMKYFQQHYKWGYSIPYFLAGMYCTHVNNIAYLLNNHGASSLDIKNVLESMDALDRLKYDYSLLEEKYVDCQCNKVDDSRALAELKGKWDGKEVLLILPGKSVCREEGRIKKYIEENDPVVVGVNAVWRGYDYHWLFFSKQIRYEYAREAYADIVRKTPLVITSNMRACRENAFVVNYNLLVKRGWMHFDNACIMFLRLLKRLRIRNVAIAGFDGFGNGYDESYADASLPHIDPGKSWQDLNMEIRDMFQDFKEGAKEKMEIRLLTKSIYGEQV